MASTPPAPSTEASAGSPDSRELILWDRSAERVRMLWVRRLWEKITHPDNESALAEWLLVVPPGQDEAWAQQALIECQRRKEMR